MSIYEYDEEKHMRMEREASFADGKLEGRKEERIALIGKYFENVGTVESAKEMWNLTDEEIQEIKGR